MILRVVNNGVLYSLAHCIECIKQDSSNSTEETPCTVKRQDHSSSISYKTQYKTTIRNAMETLKDKVEGGRESLPSWVEM